VQDPLLQQARAAALRLLERDPHLAEPSQAAIAHTLAELLRQRAVWGRIS
jgi:hypothetical protein